MFVMGNLLTALASLFAGVINLWSFVIIVSAVLSWLPKSGAKSVSPTARNVPQSPGFTLEGYSSSSESPACATWQLSS